jgi:hypothetical protein
MLETSYLFAAPLEMFLCVYVSQMVLSFNFYCKILIPRCNHQGFPVHCGIDIVTSESRDARSSSWFKDDMQSGEQSFMRCLFFFDGIITIQILSIHILHDS